jgi:hypothetical protein
MSGVEPRVNLGLKSRQPVETTFMTQPSSGDGTTLEITMRPNPAKSNLAAHKKCGSLCQEFVNPRPGGYSAARFFSRIRLLQSTATHFKDLAPCHWKPSFCLL